MDGFFPPDVRVKLEGDGQFGRPLAFAARRLLFLGLLLREQYADGRPVFIRQTLTDSAYAQVFLHQGQKILTIFSYINPDIPPPPPELPPDTLVIPEPELGSFFTLLNGWIKEGTTTIITGANGTNTSWLATYKPTPATATLYGIAQTFDLNARLVVDPAMSDAVTNPASAYSGSIKRVVQAVYGLGIIEVADVEYISGVAPDPVKRPVINQYQSVWGSTDGIYKAGTKNHWLVRISATRGVLAMPLPLFDSTKDPTYRDKLAASGDTDTLRVVDEFGGLPSGEPFPASDTVLNAAIAAGKILRLLNAADLDPFYNVLSSYYDGNGWAFSESGKEAHNTGMQWVDAAGNAYGGSSTGKRTMLGDHWKITLSLTTHNVANLTLPTPAPIGSGTAALERVSRGKIDPRGLYDLLYVQTGAGGLKRVMPDYFKEADVQWQEDTGRGIFGQPAVNEGWGATVHVFFDGERLERLKWVAQKTLVDRGVYTTPLSTLCDQTDPAAPFFIVNLDQAQVYSPAGFVGDSVDLRRPWGSSTLMTAAEAAAFPHTVVYSTWLVLYYPSGIYRYNYTPATDYVPGMYKDWGGGAAGGDASALEAKTISRCAPVAILPPNCREGYIIDFWRQGADLDHFTGAATRLFYEHQVVGYFAGLGRRDFTPPPRDKWISPLVNWQGDSPPSLVPSPQPTAYAILNAGPTKQYAMLDGICFTDDTVLKFAMSPNLPSELQTTPPYRIGWVGSV